MISGIDDRYILGLICQYMSERQITENISKNQRMDAFRHDCIVLYTCKKVKEKVKGLKSRYSNDWIWFFEDFADELDNWACSTQGNMYMSYVFSTSRDIVLDILDYIGIRIV